MAILFNDPGEWCCKIAVLLDAALAVAFWEIQHAATANGRDVAQVSSGLRVLCFNRCFAVLAHNVSIIPRCSLTPVFCYISEPLSSCIASSMSATNCVEGIKLCGGDAVIKSCKASSCSGSGIVFQGSTSACSVTNASVQNCHTGISCLEGSVVHISSSSIVGIGGSGLTSRGHCNIFLDAVSIGEVEGNMVELAAHCSLRLFKCTLRASVGSGVVVSNLSSCTIQDTSISDCGGAGVESAGKITLLSSACNSNSSGVVLLQMTEAHLTNCSFAGNSLAGVWTIGDSCHLDGCTFEANRGCAFTAGKDTKFVEEKCSLLSNGSTSTFLIWKTARRSSTVEVCICCFPLRTPHVTFLIAGTSCRCRIVQFYAPTF
jgi:hypothetical protein